MPLLLAGSCSMQAGRGCEQDVGQGAVSRAGAARVPPATAAGPAGRGAVRAGARALPGQQALHPLRAHGGRGGGVSTRRSVFTFRSVHLSACCNRLCLPSDLMNCFDWSEERSRFHLLPPEPPSPPLPLNSPWKHVTAHVRGAAGPGRSRRRLPPQPRREAGAAPPSSPPPAAPCRYVTPAVSGRARAGGGASRVPRCCRPWNSIRLALERVVSLHEISSLFSLSFFFFSCETLESKWAD